MQSQERGIRWWDISTWMHDLAKAHHCFCKFTIGVPVRQGTGKALTIRKFQTLYRDIPASGSHRCQQAGIS